MLWPKEDWEDSFTPARDPSQHTPFLKGHLNAPLPLPPSCTQPLRSSTSPCPGILHGTQLSSLKQRRWEWAEQGPGVFWRTSGPHTESRSPRPGRGFLLCSTSTWWHFKKLLPASKHPPIVVSSFCCSYFFQLTIKLKASISQAEERKGMEFWMGTETREGLERITHDPLNLPPLCLAAGSKPLSHPIPGASEMPLVSGLHGNHCPGACSPSIPPPHCLPSPPNQSQINSGQTQRQAL